jgi:hypothetical protein
MQADLEAVAAGRNSANFSQCSVVWGGFHGLGIQDVTEIPSSYTLYIFLWLYFKISIEYKM